MSLERVWMLGVVTHALLASGAAEATMTQMHNAAVPALEVDSGDGPRQLGRGLLLKRMDGYGDDDDAGLCGDFLRTTYAGFLREGLEQVGVDKVFCDEELTEQLQDAVDEVCLGSPNGDPLNELPFAASSFFADPGSLNPFSDSVLTPTMAGISAIANEFVKPGDTLSFGLGGFDDCQSASNDQAGDVILAFTFKLNGEFAFP